MSGPLLSFACSAPVRWVGAPGSWQAGQRREFQLLGTSCGDRAGWEGAREREASRELLPAGPRYLLRELALTRAFYLLDTTPPSLLPLYPPSPRSLGGLPSTLSTPAHPVRCPCCSQSPVRAFVGAHAESGPWGLAGLWPVAGLGALERTRDRF